MLSLPADDDIFEPPADLNSEMSKSLDSMLQFSDFTQEEDPMRPSDEDTLTATVSSSPGTLSDPQCPPPDQYPESSEVEAAAASPAMEVSMTDDSEYEYVKFGPEGFVHVDPGPSPPPEWSDMVIRRPVLGGQLQMATEIPAADGYAADRSSSASPTLATAESQKKRRKKLAPQLEEDSELIDRMSSCEDLASPALPNIMFPMDDLSDRGTRSDSVEFLNMSYDSCEEVFDAHKEAQSTDSLEFLGTGSEGLKTPDTEEEKSVVLTVGSVGDSGTDCSGDQKSVRNTPQRKKSVRELLSRFETSSASPPSDSGLKPKAVPRTLMNDAPTSPRQQYEIVIEKVPLQRSTSPNVLNKIKSFEVSKESSRKPSQEAPTPCTPEPEPRPVAAERKIVIVEKSPPKEQPTKREIKKEEAKKKEEEERPLTLAERMKQYQAQLDRVPPQPQKRLSKMKKPEEVKSPESKQEETHPMPLQVDTEIKAKTGLKSPQGRFVTRHTAVPSDFHTEEEAKRSLEERRKRFESRSVTQIVDQTLKDFRELSHDEERTKPGVRDLSMMFERQEPCTHDEGSWTVTL
jgi:hypothetical protein